MAWFEGAGGDAAEPIGAARQRGDCWYIVNKGRLRAARQRANNHSATTVTTQRAHTIATGGQVLHLTNTPIIPCHNAIAIVTAT